MEVKTAGRPKKTDSEQKKKLIIFYQPMIGQIDEICANEGRDWSDIIREFCRDGIKARQRENKQVAK